MTMQDLQFRTLTELLSFDHPRIDRFKLELAKIDSSLPDNLPGIDQLPRVAQERAVDFLLQSACFPSNMLSIELGRAGLLVMPKAWLVSQLREAIARNGLLADDWAYRRLLEVVCKIDLNLVRELVEFGIDSSNEDIRDAAADCREDLAAT